MRQGLCAEGDMKGKQGIAIHAAETLAILILSTLVAFIIQSLNLRVENILIIYILSILVVVMETKSYGWGIISSILCILTFNYFFVEPKYTLVMNDPSYFVSLGIFPHYTAPKPDRHLGPQRGNDRQAVQDE
jgi:two-component system sensor histidine kinase KdpD